MGDNFSRRKELCYYSQTDEVMDEQGKEISRTMWGGGADSCIYYWMKGVSEMGGVCRNGGVREILHLVSWSRVVVVVGGGVALLLMSAPYWWVNLEQRGGAHCSDMEKKVGESCGKGDSDGKTHEKKATAEQKKNRFEHCSG